MMLIDISYCPGARKGRLRQRRAYGIFRGLSTESGIGCEP